MNSSKCLRVLLLLASILSPVLGTAGDVSFWKTAGRVIQLKRKMVEENKILDKNNPEALKKFGSTMIELRTEMKAFLKQNVQESLEDKLYFGKVNGVLWTMFVKV